MNKRLRLIIKTSIAIKNPSSYRMINHFVRIKTHLFFWMLSGSFYLQKSNSGLCYGSKMLMNEIICCIDVELRYTLLGCIIHVLYMFVRCKGIILCLLYHFHDVFCVRKMRTVWICYIYRIYQRPWAKKNQSKLQTISMSF